MKTCGVPPYEGKEDYIFVSYSHSDADTVYPLIEFMSREGYRIWYDDGIHPGADWPEVIAEHLANSSGFLAFLSENAVRSHNCKKEFNYAVMKEKPQVYVLLEKTALSPAMELQLSTVQGILRYEYENENTFRQKLLDIPLFESSKGLPEEEEGTVLITDQQERRLHRVYILLRESTGEEIRITGETFRIGRKKDLCDYAIEGNKAISRVHAILYPGETECGIEDNNSLNKVYINGEQLEPAKRYPLSDGDTVLFSREKFCFRVKEEL